MAREAVYQQSDPETSATVGLPDSEKDGSLRLRPRRMDEMVGQRDVIERLKIATEAAQKRGDPRQQDELTRRFGMVLDVEETVVVMPHVLA